MRNIFKGKVGSIPNQQQNYQYDAESVRRATCLRRIFAFVIGLIVIFGTVTFIVWLILRPQLPEFRVDSLSISNFTLDNDLLISFTSEIKLTAKNPNKKMKLGYDHIETAIYYQSYSLSETTVVPFYQGTKNETSLTARFAAAGSFLEKVAVDEITGERGKNDNVNFNLRMLSRVRFEAKVWRTRRRFLKVFCGDLVLGLPTSGRSGVLTGGPRQCRVEAFPLSLNHQNRFLSPFSPLSSLISLCFSPLSLSLRHCSLLRRELPAVVPLTSLRSRHRLPSVLPLSLASPIADGQGWSASPATSLPLIPLSRFRQRTAKKEPPLQIFSGPFCCWLGVEPTRNFKKNIK
ncbi:NDR1/HIN1-like protein 10 [Salvia miltiorrhiza]|uniref:NDR1/HIN1-like protein 10 n=1 Tax=Salvia miltiorrhiza TaxID=226208 RepID=UPI0025AC2CDD|nr:NDR1/HIN1-like protein 10 [Salvia miltiorrhiza]